MQAAFAPSNLPSFYFPFSGGKLIFYSDCFDLQGTCFAFSAHFHSFLCLSFQMSVYGDNRGMLSLCWTCLQCDAKFMFYFCQMWVTDSLYLKPFFSFLFSLFFLLEHCFWLFHYFFVLNLFPWRKFLFVHLLLGYSFFWGICSSVFLSVMIISGHQAQACLIPPRAHCVLWRIVGAQPCLIWPQTHCVPWCIVGAQPCLIRPPAHCVPWCILGALLTWPSPVVRKVALEPLGALRSLHFEMYTAKCSANYNWS